MTVFALEADFVDENGIFRIFSLLANLAPKGGM